MNNLVYGVGIRDLPTTGENAKAYRTWKSMLARCFSQSVHENRPNYIGCDISSDWTYFSRFKEWFDANYIPGYQLDKDILAKGNKVYCAQYCRFVPAHINSLMSQKKNLTTGLPGVSISSDGSRYRASVLLNGQSLHIGYFADKLDAFDAYKVEKESIIKEVAIESYRRGEIDKDILNAMLEYKVER